MQVLLSRQPDAGGAGAAPGPFCLDTCPRHLANRVPLIVAFLIKFRYPTQWKDPWTQLFQAVGTRAGAGAALQIDSARAQVLLRVQLELEAEVADSRHGSADRGTDPVVDAARESGMVVKDAIRADGSVARFAALWRTLLERAVVAPAALGNPATRTAAVEALRLGRLCLRVVQGYIDWCDADLLGSNQMVGFFQRALGVRALRRPAIACVEALVVKGMSHTSKVVLLGRTKLCDAVAGLQVPGLNKLGTVSGAEAAAAADGVAFDSDDEPEEEAQQWAADVADLCCATVLRLMEAIQDAQVVANERAAAFCASSLRALLGMALRLLATGPIDIVVASLPAAKALAAVLRRAASAESKRRPLPRAATVLPPRPMLPALVRHLICGMELPAELAPLMLGRTRAGLEALQAAAPGSDAEALVAEWRRQRGAVAGALGELCKCPSLVAEVVGLIAAELGQRLAATGGSLASLPFGQGEAITKAVVLASQSASRRMARDKALNAAMNELFLRLLAQRPWTHPNPAVAAAGLEALVRGLPALKGRPEALAAVVPAFVGPGAGLNSPVAGLRQHAAAQLPTLARTAVPLGKEASAQVLLPLVTSLRPMTALPMLPFDPSKPEHRAASAVAAAAVGQLDAFLERNEPNDAGLAHPPPGGLSPTSQGAVLETSGVILAQPWVTNEQRAEQVAVLVAPLAAQAQRVAAGLAGAAALTAWRAEAAAAAARPPAQFPLTPPPATAPVFHGVLWIVRAVDAVVRLAKPLPKLTPAAAEPLLTLLRAAREALALLPAVPAAAAEAGRAKLRESSFDCGLRVSVSKMLQRLLDPVGRALLPELSASLPRLLAAGTPSATSDAMHLMQRVVDKLGEEGARAVASHMPAMMATVLRTLARSKAIVHAAWTASDQAGEARLHPDKALRNAGWDPDQMRALLSGLHQLLLVAATGSGLWLLHAGPMRATLGDLMQCLENSVRYSMLNGVVEVKTACNVLLALLKRWWPGPLKPTAPAAAAGQAPQLAGSIDGTPAGGGASAAALACDLTEPALKAAFQQAAARTAGQAALSGCVRETRFRAGDAESARCSEAVAQLHLAVAERVPGVPQPGVNVLCGTGGFLQQLASRILPPAGCPAEAASAYVARLLEGDAGQASSAWVQVVTRTRQARQARA